MIGADKSARLENCWPLFCHTSIIFTYLKLWIASARNNFRLVKKLKGSNVLFFIFQRICMILWTRESLEEDWVRYNYFSLYWCERYAPLPWNFFICFILFRLMTVHRYYYHITPFSARNVTLWRLKSIPAIKESNKYNDRTPIKYIFK